MSQSGDHHEFEIEKEYDARYEGLDFDDVDERPMHMTETQDEDATLPQSSNLPPHSQVTEHEIANTLETLERAEAIEDQIHAHKNPKNRIIDRLEGNTNGNASTIGVGSGVAAPLASSQAKLAEAVASNSELSSSIKNPFSFVAALSLELIPQGASKSTVLSKLAAALRFLKTATSPKELVNSLGLADTSINFNGLIADKQKSINKDALKTLSMEIKRAFELAERCKEESTSTPQTHEQTVRALLKLASAPVTANLLSECDQAGKKMRKLKNHPVVAVAQASEAVVKAWKQELS